MKLSSLSVLWLPLILFHISVSLARRGKSGGGIGRATKSTNSGNTHSNTNAGNRNTQSGSHRNTAQNNVGRQGRINSYPRQPVVVVHGGLSRPGGYAGGYINYNPNNKILSPRYGGRFGNSAYGTQGGSPYSHRISEMGMFPSSRSRGFGHNAAQAVATGMMFRMAVGYGLGRSPRQDIHFQNSQQEHHYNRYMHQKYGSRSTDTNDYSRDYTYSPLPVTYDIFMSSCMNRSDLLPADGPKRNKPGETTTTASVGSSSNTDAGTNTTESNSLNNTAMDPFDSSSIPDPLPLNHSETRPDSPAPLVVSSDEDDDTVSIVEIGYPALIEQMKARICVEKYIEYSDQYLKRLRGGAEGLKMGFEGLLAVFATTILVLNNSNMLLR